MDRLVPSNKHAQLALGLGSAVLVYQAVKRLYGSGLLVCMPPGWSWLWGHEPLVYGQPSGDYYMRWFNEYGPAFKIHAALSPHREILVIADPAALAHIYVKNVYDYPHSKYLTPLIEKVLGKGLITANDRETHVPMRRMLNPMFSESVVKTYGDDIGECANTFNGRLDALCDLNGHAVIDLCQWVWKPTLDVIGRTGFNHDFECGNSVAAREVFDAMHMRTKMNLGLAGIMVAAVPRTFPWILKLPMFANGGHDAGRLRIHKLARDTLLEDRRATEDRHDLLSILMRHANIDEKEQPDERILDHISTFIVGGHETVASVLAYTLWQISRHTDIQTQLRAEVLAFHSHTPTFDDLMASDSKLPLLDAICKESLRLYQPAGHTERTAERDDVIPLHFPVRTPSGGYTKEIRIKKGQTIWLSGMAVDRLQRVWGKDADVWRPSRWNGSDFAVKNMDGDVAGRNKGWNGLFVFGQGAKSCIGVRLAVFELKYLVFNLVRQFKLHDTGAHIVWRSSSAVQIPQPLVVGREEEGPCLPVELSLY